MLGQRLEPVKPTSHSDNHAFTYASQTCDAIACKGPERWVPSGSVIPEVLLPYSPERDAYRLLQISPHAGRDEILAACRRLALAFHPDRNRSARATDEMQVVNAIRAMLTDPRSRAEYDWSRLRWHAAERGRMTGMAVGWRQAAAAPARRRPLLPGRYARAALLATRATLTALLPERCTGCRMVVEEDDAWCGACGSRLLLPATQTAG